jgi:3-oxoacyl-(acyl-carrier protein) reductase
MNIIISGITGDLGFSIFERFNNPENKIFGFYYSNDSQADIIKQLASDTKCNLTLFKGDIGDYNFLQQSVKYIFENNRKIDLLINNAGRNIDSLFINMKLADWTNVLKTNLFSNIYLTELLLEKQENFKILNIVSVSAVYGREGQANYASSKGGVIGYSKLLSSRSDKNVQVLNVAPGMINSSMVNQVPKTSVDTFLNYTSVKKLGEAFDISEFAYYYGNSESDYLANTTIKIDGGFLR